MEEKHVGIVIQAACRETLTYLTMADLPPPIMKITISFLFSRLIVLK
jgi:hypothetical protein